MIASHNSWTFATPRRWWMRILAPVARCQRKDIYWQLTHGVTLFDLRLKIKDGMILIAHGPMEFRLKTEERSLDDELGRISRWGGCQVRVLLETRNPTEHEIECFWKYVGDLAVNFPRIYFIGGHGAHGESWWQEYYPLSRGDYKECHASVGGRLLGRVFPLLFVRDTDESEKSIIRDMKAQCMVDYVDEWL